VKIIITITTTGFEDLDNFISGLKIFCRYGHPNPCPVSKVGIFCGDYLSRLDKKMDKIDKVTLERLGWKRNKDIGRWYYYFSC
jgi:hypothetical protein